MDNNLSARIRELIQQGEKIVPEGGLEFSGYNAKLQGQYLLWRKSCLDVVGKLGEPGIALRAQIANDENGAYFYQSSAQVVLNAIKSSLSLVGPEEFSALKPIEEPLKPPLPAPARRTPAGQSEEGPDSGAVLVASTPTDPLLSPLLGFLKEIGVASIVHHRTPGASESFVEQVEQAGPVHYAFFLLSAEDIPNTMFELGYLAGKLGAHRVCCIHMKDVLVPRNLPGIDTKEIVVKFEEVGFALMKELKIAGYSVQL